MPNYAVKMKYDEIERTNSQMNEQTTPEDHTNLMESITIMTECRHITKNILRTELRTQKQMPYKFNIKKYLRLPHNG